MSFEQPKFENSQRGSGELEKTDEEVFREYCQDLELSPEDFDKKILDIGAGGAKFAKWAKEHNVSSEIYSLEPYEELKEKTKAVRGLAEQLPFADDSFDLVVSNAAIPNIFLEQDKNKVRESFLEALRVVKPGGEVRFAKVAKGAKGESWSERKELTRSIITTLAELKKSGVGVEEIHQPYADIHKQNRKGKKGRLLSETYLIKLHKPVK
jgi:ubiquinone/menaquinone biosynthesis C-methylase UbiE